MKASIFYSLILMLGLVACKKDPVNSCIDPSLMTGGGCYLVYDPVCGCDGETYANACIAKNQHGVTSYTPGACDCSYPYTGEIVDYTGLDGCGLMIELDNGDVLEPKSWPRDFVPADGMRINLNYREITSVASICMAGKIAEILCARPSPQSCLPIDSIAMFPTFPPAGFQDPITITHAEIRGHCLHIKYSHGGGCEKHEYKLFPQPLFCGTPPVPDLMLQFAHNANGDQCEALLSGELSYDLVPLQRPGQNSMEIHLLNFGTASGQQFVLEYKY